MNDVWDRIRPDQLVAEMAVWLDGLLYDWSEPVYVCICGGRKFNDWSVLNVLMARVRMSRSISGILTGGAPGADQMGSQWGRKHCLPVREIKARWATLGRAAGPIRNGKLVTALLDQKNPVVIALPGEIGTPDMIIQCRQAGIPVFDVEEVIESIA